MTPDSGATIPRDGLKRPIVNGVGAVVKIKRNPDGEVELHRFISIFCPINDFFEKIPGDEAQMLCFGQHSLILLCLDEEVLFNSEVFESCVNLFSLPSEWLSYFA